MQTVSLGKQDLTCHFKSYILGKMRKITSISHLLNLPRKWWRLTSYYTCLKFEQLPFCNLGPVVQSIVSLTSSSVVKMLTVLVIFFFFFFWFGFYGPFKNISLISSRSFIEGGRKPENPEKNHLTIRKQNLAFPHMTRARLEPQRWET